MSDSDEEQGLQMIDPVEEDSDDLSDSNDEDGDNERSNEIDDEDDHENVSDTPQNGYDDDNGDEDNNNNSHNTDDDVHDNDVDDDVDDRDDDNNDRDEDMDLNGDDSESTNRVNTDNNNYDDEGRSEVNLTPATDTMEMHESFDANPEGSRRGIRSQPLKAGSRVRNRIIQSTALVEVLIEGKIHNLEPDTRMCVVHRHTGRKLAGTAAPRARNVKEWLATHPNYRVTIAGPSRRRKPGAANRPGRAGNVAGRRVATSWTRGRGKKLLPGQYSRNQIMIPLPESTEVGPGGDFVIEVKRLYKEGKRLLDVGSYREALVTYETAIEFAKRAATELQEAQKLFDLLPDIRSRKVLQS